MTKCGRLSIDATRPSDSYLEHLDAGADSLGDDGARDSLRRRITRDPRLTEDEREHLLRYVYTEGDCFPSRPLGND